MIVEGFKVFAVANSTFIITEFDKDLGVKLNLKPRLYLYDIKQAELSGHMLAKEHS
jgi:hypothetical protein